MFIRKSYFVASEIYIFHISKIQTHFITDIYTYVPVFFSTKKAFGKSLFFLIFIFN